MNVLGVSRILNEAGGTAWGGVSGIEPFVPKGHVRHYEGELQRKFKVVTPHKIKLTQSKPSQATAFVWCDICCTRTNYLVYVTYRMICTHVRQVRE